MQNKNNVPVLPGWVKKDNAKKEIYVKEHDGSLYLYEVTGSARSFFQMQGAERIQLDIIPTWIQEQINSLHVGTNDTKCIVNPGDIEYTGKSIFPRNDQLILDANGFPEQITDLLFEKWTNLPVEKRLIMLQKTDPRYIQERKGRGGTYKYVDINYMIRAANMAFGFAWNVCVDKFEGTATEAICFGHIEAKIGDTWIVKHAVGQQDIKYTKDSKEIISIGDDYKGAESDMIKKALSMFGIASDVYGGEI